MSFQAPKQMHLKFASSMIHVHQKFLMMEMSLAIKKYVRRMLDM
jgi:hypothetical protein